MSKIIAVDVDMVLADLHTEWLARYNRDYNDNLIPQEITVWELEKLIKPECGFRIFEYLFQQDLYKNIKPIPGALDGINEIREAGYRVIFATSCVPDTAGNKVRWLVENGFMPENKKGDYKDFIDVNDKSLVYADVLIDDKIKNLDNFKGMPICFDQPYNKNTQHRRLLSWSSMNVKNLLYFLRGEANFGKSVLEEAQSLVYGDRQAAYGHPYDDYTRTGMMMGAVLWEWAKEAGKSSVPLAIPAKEAALCMATVKISREVNKHKRDNMTDLAGYAAVVQRIMEKINGY